MQPSSGTWIQSTAWSLQQSRPAVCYNNYSKLKWQSFFHTQTLVSREEKRRDNGVQIISAHHCPAFSLLIIFYIQFLSITSLPWIPTFECGKKFVTLERHILMKQAELNELRQTLLFKILDFYNLNAFLLLLPSCFIYFYFQLFFNQK